MNTPFVVLFLAFILLEFTVFLRFWVERSPATGDKTPPWRRRARVLPTRELLSFTGFTVALLAAHLAAVDDHRVAILGWAFVAARVLHLPIYLADLIYLRGLVGAVGFLITATLFILAAAQ